MGTHNHAENIRQCISCNQYKELRLFEGTRKKCRKCRSHSHYKNRKTDPDYVQKHKLSLAKYRRNIGDQEFLRRKNVARRRQRERIIEHYGNECACCGEATYEFLAIDHINGGGAKHRRTLKSRSIYEWLIANNLPEGFRVLCHNCNMAHGCYGYCPHTVADS